MTRGSRTFEFSYDAYGNPVSLAYRSNATAEPTYYYYALNSRGDVIALYDSTGNLYATYSYDAYGKFLVAKNASGVEITGNTSVAILNPLRYRGYVYDTETGFYYLQSRYYDPTACRFVNADVYCSTGQDITGNNMFAYCNNNPVMFSDSTGTWALFECCPQNNCYYCQQEKKKIGEYTGAATAYTPTSSPLSNCLSYILGEGKAVFIGGHERAITNYDIDNVSDMLIETLDNMNIGIRVIESSISPITPKEYRIAMRTNNKSDYHFMMQHSDGTWSHKLSVFSSRKIDGSNPYVISWDLLLPKENGTTILTSEGIFFDEGEYIENYYNSRTVYFAISK